MLWCLDSASATMTLTSCVSCRSSQIRSALGEDRRREGEREKDIYGKRGKKKISMVREAEKDIYGKRGRKRYLRESPLMEVTCYLKKSTCCIDRLSAGGWSISSTSQVVLKAHLATHSLTCQTRRAPTALSHTHVLSSMIR